MPALEKTLRTQLERIVRDAREIAEAGAKSALETLGVGDSAAPSYLSDDQRNIRRRLRIHGRQLGDLPDEKAKTQQIERLTEEVAYEHWHRMLFARFLAENNLLMYDDSFQLSVVSVQPPHPLKTEPLKTENCTPISLDEAEDLAADHGLRNRWDLAARLATRMLPQIFRIESPVFELELPPENQQGLDKLVAELPVDVFTASDALGWVYQFWQANRKKQINEAEVKIGARELPAVTQLFTEDYMVDFLLDNTLGAWWAGKQDSVQFSVSSEESEVRAAVALPGCPWNYLRFTNQPEGVSPRLPPPNHETPPPPTAWRPAAGCFDGWPTSARDLKCLDPCMGSGHFIVAMFERLVALRMAEESSTEADAVAAVIRDNLYGLEIDPRCTQIAAFNLALAAWKRIGYCSLPPMNLACSGLAPNTSREEWLALAGDSEKLRNGMERLFELFEQAPVLGSLINPRAEIGSLLDASYQELQPLLERALSHEAITENCNMKAEAFHELAVTARGLAKAAEILAGQFSLVATNVPFLGGHKQCSEMAQYLSQEYKNAGGNLANAILIRLFKFLGERMTIAVVTPQDWMLSGRYKNLREVILSRYTALALAFLGTHAFETIDGEVVTAGLSIWETTAFREDECLNILAIDGQGLQMPREKACTLGAGSIIRRTQAHWLTNPNSRITVESISGSIYLSKYARPWQGVKTSDDDRFVTCTWEHPGKTPKWRFYLRSLNVNAFSGLEHLLLWEDGRGQLREVSISQSRDRKRDLQGINAWGKTGIVINTTGRIVSSLYLGEAFASEVVVLTVKEELLLPLLTFTNSPQFAEAVKKLDKRVSVTTSTFSQVPVDLSYWQQVAAEKYPHGLPKPFSSDPTQWLFNGHPHGSDNPLQVAVARLVGYQWPRQTGSSFPDCPALGPDGLEAFADHDGIVCIPPVRGEPSAADRLLNLLAAAYQPAGVSPRLQPAEQGPQLDANACRLIPSGSHPTATETAPAAGWSTDILNKLLSDAGYGGKSLETWLRDGFFQQHCELFHQRPFVWHIWDGLRDGFAALINYHKLDHKNLQTLIYTYLGDWISRCEAQDKSSGLTEDGEKTTAAKNLKRKLELILAGEAPHDIFVRWKPLHQQPIGWNPDINDGVRLNIRPFVSVPDVKAKGAGILRVKPKIKWGKDRGKEPQREKTDYPWFWGWDEKTTDFPGGDEFTGERFNDCHYTLAAKQRACNGKALKGK